MIVSEVFGPTVQGEGPSAGRRAGFLRLGRCNLDCSWCDTPYTWDWERFDPAAELSDWELEVLLEELKSMNVPLIVITGGEPLIQRRELARLISALPTGVDVEIETNGTIAPKGLTELPIRFNVSPKLPHSGVKASKAIRPEILAEFVELDSVFKFVVCSHDDFRIIDTMNLPERRVWVMPEGRSVAELDSRRGLVEGAIKRGWNVSDRMHIRLWGDVRGV